MPKRMLTEAKVAWEPGATFFPLYEEPHHARMSFSALPEDRLQNGLQRLGLLLTDQLG